MSIIRADISQLETVKTITTTTIKEIYPHYYPKGAVDFFLSHHNEDNISKDLESGMVYLTITPSREAAATITIRENEICRLFVLPQYQRQGFGRELLDFAENKISEYHNRIILDASLPAKAIYLKRGYKETAAHSVKTDSGDFLCYDVMQKLLRIG